MEIGASSLCIKTCELALDSYEYFSSCEEPLLGGVPLNKVPLLDLRVLKVTGNLLATGDAGKVKLGTAHEQFSILESALIRFQYGSHRQVVFFFFVVFFFQL